MTSEPDPGQILARLAANLGCVITGKPAHPPVSGGLRGGGHVLLEDVPGTGETTFAEASIESDPID